MFERGSELAHSGSFPLAKSCASNPRFGFFFYLFIYLFIFYVFKEWTLVTTQHFRLPASLDNSQKEGHFPAMSWRRPSMKFPFPVLLYAFVCIVVLLVCIHFCVAYTKCKPLNAMAQDIYSWICHGEQSGCHVVYYRRRQAPVYSRLSYVNI